MSYLTQMLALAVQNFLSAATGIVVVFALIRGFIARTSSTQGGTQQAFEAVAAQDQRTAAAMAPAATLGNFWVDITRVTACVLLPLLLVFAGFLVS